MKLHFRAASYWLAALVFWAFIFPVHKARADSQLISTSAGKVGGSVITTRQVLLYNLIEGALWPDEKVVKLRPGQVKSREFIHETTSVLLEIAIAKEGIAFSSETIPVGRVDKSVKKVNSRLKRNSIWHELNPTSEEIKEIVTTKLRAKSFLKFKVQSATIPVSDDDAKSYFNANQLKFENLPFSDFKDTIKAYLTKQRVDVRLADWFEQLRLKYHIRNFLAE